MTIISRNLQSSLYASLARREIEIFYGFEEDDSFCEVPSLAKNEINTFYGYDEYKKIPQIQSIAKSELETYHCSQGDEEYKLIQSLARHEIDTFNGHVPEEPQYKVQSLANSELNAFYGIQNYNNSQIKIQSIAAKEINISREKRNNKHSLKGKSIARDEIDLYLDSSDYNYRSVQNRRQFKYLYESLVSKIQIIHRSISGSDTYDGIDSLFSYIHNYIQKVGNSTQSIQKVENLTQSIQKYETANKKMKETIDAVDHFLNDQISTQNKSFLPSLKRNDSPQFCEEETVDDLEVKTLKYEVESLQNKINEIEQQIMEYRSKTVNLRQPNKHSKTASPRVLRNKIRSMQKKVDQGDADAMYSMGACYSLGDGVPVDKEKALHFYLLSAKKGNKNAQYAAAACYSYGKGTEIDKNKAFELYLSAAKQGHPKAQFAVGHFFEYGLGGVELDHEVAKKWYRMAAEQGHDAARKFLDDCSSENQINDE